MPFKSEAQRRYLWANEPEIARDWTDTYGSRIHKAGGQLVQPGIAGIGRPGYNGQGDYTPDRSPGRTAPGGGAGRDILTGQRTIGQTVAKRPSPVSTGEQINQLINKYIGGGPNKLITQRSTAINKNRDLFDKLLAADLLEETGGVGAWDWKGKDPLESQATLDLLKDYGYQGGYHDVNDPGHPNYDPRGGGEGQGTDPWLYPQGGIASVDDTITTVADLGLGSGHFRVPEQYRVAEGGRIPAAFGGIMDSETGRRGYGFGSFIKKAFKKATKAVKKLAKSDIGKLALMYGAGTYLGGTQAFGGTGWGSGAGATPWKKFGAKLLDPTGSQGIGNLARPGRWGMFQKATPALNLSSAERGFNLAPGFDSTIGNLGKLGEGAKKAAGLDWSKWILPASIAAGYGADKMPGDTIDEGTAKWDAEKAKWDRFYANLDDEDSYRVPEDLRAAQGGRIGAQEGGLMDLGGMEKDYREDGGFVPLGGEEKADDVPARLSRNEFVFTADAVRNAGGGDIDKGAEVMENVMKNLEAGGKVSEESQGQGAQDMFEVSERLSEVV